MGINRRLTPLAARKAVEKLARKRRLAGEKRHYTGARRLGRILAQIEVET